MINSELQGACHLQVIEYVEVTAQLCVPAIHRCGSAAGLKNFCQLGCESARRLLRLILFGGSLASTRAMLFAIRRGAICRGLDNRLLTLSFKLCRLGRIRPQQLVFERGPVEPADNGLHLVRCRCLDKSEALRFLRFMIADHFNRIRNEVVCAEPSLNVVGGDPCG